MVYSAGEGGGSRRPPDREVPFEQVGFQRCRVVVGRGLRSELGGFFENAFDGWGLCGHVVLRGEEAIVSRFQEIVVWMLGDLPKCCDCEWNGWIAGSRQLLSVVLS